MNKTGQGSLLKKISKPLSWLLGISILSMLVYLFWRENWSKNKQPLHLFVYAFSTQEEVLTQGIFPAFKQNWEAETGQDLTINSVFGPSGTLALQITQGAPADIAILSNQRHIDWLKFSRCVDKDTDEVLIASTPLVIITRSGNPKAISDYASLTQPGIALLHADPRNSGVGEWAVLAEYGSAYLETGDHNIGLSQLHDIWQNVQLLGISARATLALFELGAGDAFVTYEQDAYLARERHVPLEMIMPQRTILTRNYAVIVDDNVTQRERPVIEAFLAFIQSSEGQHILKQYYYRPATAENDELPVLNHPFTEEDLGGWHQAYNDLIENYWKTEIEPNLKLEPATTYLGRGE